MIFMSNELSKMIFRRRSHKIENNHRRKINMLNLKKTYERFESGVEFDLARGWVSAATILEENVIETWIF